MGWPEAELSLTLLGDRAMARLNRETFGRPGPTNVISFPVEEMMVGGGDQGVPTGETPALPAPAPSPKPPPPTPYIGITAQPEAAQAFQPGLESASQPGPPALLGEVVISIETTRRQAKEFGWPWQELFDFFLIHGILHLLGYDHGTPGDEEIMTVKTWELMEVLYPKLKNFGE